MNKKSIIQIVVIVVCMGASAIVVYNNFFKKAEIPDSVLNAGAGVPQVPIDQPILPAGSSFDLTALKKSPLNFNLITYPKLDYPQDIGVDQMQMIKSLQKSQAN